MTLSVAELKANAEKTLRLLWESIEERHFDSIWFDHEHADWSFVLATTWVQLRQDGYLQLDADEYRLTSYGWGEAEQQFADAEELRRRCQALHRTLSEIATNDGRQSDSYVFEVENVAADSRLPVGWVFNVLSSCVLQNMFGDERCDIEGDGSGVFRILSTFGHPQRQR